MVGDGQSISLTFPDLSPHIISYLSRNALSCWMLNLPHLKNSASTDFQVALWFQLSQVFEYGYLVFLCTVLVISNSSVLSIELPALGEWEERYWRFRRGDTVRHGGNNSDLICEALCIFLLFLSLYHCNYLLYAVPCTLLMWGLNAMLVYILMLYSK